jgi:hypothetical protein
MLVQVRYKSEILGSGVFWEGTKDGADEIGNVVAYTLALMAFRDGGEHTRGIWTASPVTHVPHEQMIQTCLGEKHEN